MKNINFQNISKNLFTLLATIALTTLGVQAWQGLTAETGDRLDYAKWNQLVNSVQSGIPTGAVMSFNLSSCPSGWSEYTNARGRTIIGTGDGAGTNESLGALGGDKSKPSASGYTVNTTLTVSSTTTSGQVGTPSNGSTITVAPIGQPSAYIFLPNSSGTFGPVTLGGINSILSGGGTAPDNMQPYVALLYCVKN